MKKKKCIRDFLILENPRVPLIVKSFDKSSFSPSHGEITIAFDEV